MFIVVEENNNSRADERVFATSGQTRTVRRAQVNTPEGKLAWCDVTGVEEAGAFTPAQAVTVDDSGAGTAWLIYGGSWGLRFRPSQNQDSWSLADTHQWGEPFKVLDAAGDDIEFSD